jgi:MFS family permease
MEQLLLQHEGGSAEDQKDAQPFGSSSRPPPAAATVAQKKPQQQEADLPLWWLVFISLYYFPIMLSWTLLGSIMLPKAVAQVGGGAARLGTAAAIGSAMQFIQPFVGAWSDRMQPWGCMGRRRPFVVFGQGVSCAGCALMMWAAIGLAESSTAATHSGSGGGLDTLLDAEVPEAFTAWRFWALTAGYTLYMLGNGTGYGVYPSLISNHVPEQQRGLASGLQGIFLLLGQLASGGIGVIAGSGDCECSSAAAALHLTHQSEPPTQGWLVGWGRRSRHLLGTDCSQRRQRGDVSHLIQQHSKPRLPGRKPRTPIATLVREQAEASIILRARGICLRHGDTRMCCVTACRAGAKSEFVNFFSAFRSRGFHVVFWIMALASFAQFISMTFFENFLRDRVDKPFMVGRWHVTT